MNDIVRFIIIKHETAPVKSIGLFFRNIPENSANLPKNYEKTGFCLKPLCGLALDVIYCI
ncbi:MAG: hypothetical protein HFG17_07220 [Oscillospiraceae bacterium]|nr:hypothetical protein [Oscillospiraceae bacterium]